MSDAPAWRIRPAGAASPYCGGGQHSSGQGRVRLSFRHMDGYAFDTQTDELYKKQGVDRMSVRVVIATHKPCAVPSDPLYLPLCVGVATAAPTGFAGDDTGESITEKNSTFCELTGLYWAWKNLPDDYIGLVHYRRYFSTHRCFRYRRALRQVLTLEQAQSLLQGRDGILPRPRRYYIETLYSHYAHTSYEEPLAETGRILQERYPAYYPAFQRLHRRTAAHMFNMMILRRDHLDAYCTWLFDILFELEQRVDTTGYSKFHARFFGRVSELLLDVWLEQHPLDCVQLPVVSTVRTPWLRKGWAFLAAKFAGRKYEESF